MAISPSVHHYATLLAHTIDFHLLYTVAMSFRERIFIRRCVIVELKAISNESISRMSQITVAERSDMMIIFNQTVKSYYQQCNRQLQVYKNQ